MLESVDDLGRVLQSALGHERGKPHDRLDEPVDVVQDQETLHSGPAHDEVVGVGHPDRPGRVVGRDRTAARDAGADRQVGERSIEDLAAHVVEVDVDAIRTQFDEPRPDVFGLVVDARIEPEVLDDPTALLVTASDTDDGARSLDLRQLTRDGANPTGRAGHDERLAGLQFADVFDAEPGRDTGRAVDGQQIVDLESWWNHVGHGVVGEQPVVLPARHSHHQIADRESVAPRFDHLGDSGGAYDRTDLHRGEVRVLLAHPDAVRGID